MTQKFFIQPFAFAGDVAAIPEAVQPDGSVSYNSGWGFDYQRDLLSDPDAKPVPRDQTNRLMYDITNGIGILQRWGAAEFITSADNGGTPFPYGIGAQVVFTFAAPGSLPKVYMSRITANTGTPEANPGDWQLMSALAGGGGTTFASEAETNAKVVTNKAIAPDVAGLCFAYLNGAAFTGAVTAPSFTTPSDIRLKDNVRPYDGPTGDLELMSWTWNAEAPGDLAGTDDSGVIAQDVQRAYPSCVYEDRDGILHVNYAKLAVHLILKKG